MTEGDLRRLAKQIIGTDLLPDSDWRRRDCRKQLIELPRPEFDFVLSILADTDRQRALKTSK